MTDDKGAGEGPFTKIECLRHFETWAKSFIFSGDGIRDVEVVEPRLGYSIELAIANRLYAEGRKAERERCARIADGLLNLEVGDLVGTSIATKIRGGHDEK
jgi:hypothetical protein